MVAGAARSRGFVGGAGVLWVEPESFLCPAPAPAPAPTPTLTLL